MRPGLNSLLAWWYGALAVGFTLLAIDHVVLHDKPWLIGLRLILAAGFGFLSYLEFSKRKKL